MATDLFQDQLTTGTGQKPKPTAQTLQTTQQPATTPSPHTTTKPQATSQPLQPSPTPVNGGGLQAAPPAAMGGAMTPQEAAAAGLAWVPPDHPLYGQPGYVGSQPTATTPGGNGGGGGTSTYQPEPYIPLGSPTQPQEGQPPQTPSQQLQAMVREQLMGMLGQDVNQASITDPDLAPQARAFQSAIDRATAAQRRQLVHQASREGWADSGGFDERAAALAQQGAQTIGAFQADLVGQKLQQRRDQLQTALAAAMQLGLTEEAQDLQRQLANLDAMLQREGYSLQERLGNLDAELRRLGITTQSELGRRDIDVRRELGIGGLNLGLLQTLLDNQQFNDRLGFDIGALAAGLNRDALLAGLRG